MNSGRPQIASSHKTINNCLPRDISLHTIKGNQMKLGHLVSICRYWGPGTTSIARLWSTSIESRTLPSPGCVFGLIPFWLRDGIRTSYADVWTLNQEANVSSRISRESCDDGNYEPAVAGMVTAWPRAKAIGSCPTHSRFRPTLATISSLIYEYGN